MYTYVRRRRGAETSEGDDMSTKNTEWTKGISQYAANPVPVTKVPARLEPLNMGIGWTVFEFATAKEAAEWVASFPQAAMPCWKRWETRDGNLMLVR
jgi:endo-beta-N-acetylglucosaminidase D